MQNQTETLPSIPKHLSYLRQKLPLENLAVQQISECYHS